MAERTYAGLFYQVNNLLTNSVLDTILHVMNKVYFLVLQKTGRETTIQDLVCGTDGHTTAQGSIYTTQ